MSGLSRPRAPGPEAGGAALSPRTAGVRILRVAIVLSALFTVLALAMLIRDTPIAFTLFMFVGQPLFVVALILLVGAIAADLKARQLL